MFAELGASEEQVLAAVSRDGIEEVTAADLRHLKGMFAAIRDGVLTLDGALRPPEADKRGPATTSESKLGEKFKRKSKTEEKPDDVDQETGEVK